MSGTTTIQIPLKLKKELDSLKDYGRQTYAGVINKLVDLAREEDEAKLELSVETLKAVREAREDLKKGRAYTTKQVRKELGL